MPHSAVPNPNPKDNGDFILYQGALNEGRGLSCLLEVVQKTGIPCILAGDGDIAADLKQQAKAMKLDGLVTFTGMLRPEDLKTLTQTSWLGVNLLEASSPNYYYSLANKFFDYVQAGKPQLCMAYPEYERLQKEHEVAVLVDKLDSDWIAEAILQLKADQARYGLYVKNCREASLHWIWEIEEQQLLKIYAKV
jgi:hypothetical protein